MYDIIRGLVRIFFCVDDGLFIGMFYVLFILDFFMLF